jgi:hypothetical protein
MSFVLAMIGCGMAVNVYAAGLETYAFPQKGQTAELQKQDEGYCTQWAQEQTGLDLAVLKYKQQEAVAAQQQAQEASTSRPGRPLLRTVATGAALGGINNNMDDGAGKGAVTGVALAASRARTQSFEKKTEGTVNAADTQSQSVQSDSEKYVRAYGACMEGKGYSIR